MALKQRHRTAEVATNDTKMGWNCNRNREKGKYNSKMHTVTWLWSPHYVKQQVFKFRLGTDYSTHLRGPLKYQALFEKLCSFLLGRSKNQTSQESSRSWAYTQARATLHTIGGGVRLVLVLFLHGWWNAFYVPKMCIPFFFSWYGRNYCQSFPEGTSEKCKLFMQDCWYQTAN